MSWETIVTAGAITVSAQRWIHSGSYLYFFTQSAYGLSFILLCAALLMFCMKNRIPCVLSASPEQEKAALAKMRPEKALKQLDEQYEFGLISADTFRSLRTEIRDKP